ncbi:MAG: efflux RND transporter periplasmic adaptor subunit [Alphaproteobacteria bacterium]|nr:efflux RND transporter periplasmic adaptor subunit [Alphaproteobacteria bacterium]
MRSPHRLSLILCLSLLGPAACKPSDKAEAPEPRPVRTVTVAVQPTGEKLVLTGHIQAEDEVSFAFRLSGRMIERPVNVGDRIKPGQELAKLDPENEVNALRSAQASVAAAHAAVNQSRAAFERQRTLLAQGHTPRSQFDLAEKALQSARSQLDDAEAQFQIAGRRVSWTILTADAPGTVIARGAEPGEVVQAGQMIVRVARQGGRDAVFDVPAQMLRGAPEDTPITVALADDPSVKANGRVREIAAQADPATRTFEVKVGLTDPPAAMRLGSTVNGTAQFNAADMISIPASALTELNRQPAVWIVDPKKLTVSMRNISVARFDPGTVVVAEGLETGDIVVTAGVQALHPGQKVRLLGPTS